MIVVDANVIAYFVIRGEATALAVSVAEKDSDWRAPRLWSSEVLSTLAGYVRRGTISIQIAKQAFREAEAAIASEVAIDELRVLELVKSSGCSSYDCEYIAAAELLCVPLVTNDKQILQSFPRIAISMRDFIS